VAYSDYQKAGASSSLPTTKQFLEYVYSAKAQNQLPGLGYAPLPPALANPAKAQIATLR